MGGRALKNTFTRRYTKQEFEDVSAELLETIRASFDRADTPLYYHNKETFGDIDIIVDNGDNTKALSGIRNYINTVFKPNEIFHNGNCYSFDYKEVQVDFMCIPSEDYDSNYHYLAFNDLGNYIGRIAHRLGLKYGQEGLWYNHYLKGQNLGRVMISKDYREIFKFLDLDYDRWLEGFDELEDTFEFALTSKYFDSQMFQLDSLNRINRERNLKRASYMSFLDWIGKNHPNVVGDYLDGPKEDARASDNTNKSLIKTVNAKFPEANFTLKIKEIEYEEAKKAYINAKFNGSMVMNIYGLKGKEIGDALKHFKREIEKEGYAFDDYILSESQENIFEQFEYINL
jgi:hypothetical protein